MENVKGGRIANLSIVCRKVRESQTGEDILFLIVLVNFAYDASFIFLQIIQFKINNSVPGPMARANAGFVCPVPILSHI